MKLTEKMTNC